jgi:hypothetical protein
VVREDERGKTMSHFDDPEFMNGCWDSCHHADGIILAHHAKAWQETAEQIARDAQFYRGLVSGIGAQFGKTAYTSDDGSVQQDVLALKVPDLVKEALQEIYNLKWALHIEIEGEHVEECDCLDHRKDAKRLLGDFKCPGSHCMGGADRLPLSSEKLADTFASMRRDGQGLSQDQEQTIRRGLGLDTNVEGSVE